MGIVCLENLPPSNIEHARQYWPLNSVPAASEVAHYVSKMAQRWLKIVDWTCIDFYCNPFYTHSQHFSRVWGSPLGIVCLEN